jgi:hypothetical protein
MIILAVRHHIWVYSRMFYYWNVCIKWSYLWVVHLLNQTLPTPPSIYFRHNWASLLSPIYIYVICDTPEQMSGGDTCILNRPSPPHLPYRHIPLTCKGGRKWKIGNYYRSRMGEIYDIEKFQADRPRFKRCSPRGCPRSSHLHPVLK